jgi:hypothetical protein
LALPTLQVFDQLKGQPQAAGQPLPHTHWLYWLQYSADDFPADKLLSSKPCTSSSSSSSSLGGIVVQCGEGSTANSSSSNISTSTSSADSSMRASHAQQQDGAAVVSGACDITTFRRCLLQQLYSTAPGHFEGPVASTLQTASQNVSRTVSSKLWQQQAPLPAAASSRDRSDQQQRLVDAAAKAILARMGMTHRSFVENELEKMTPPDWQQRQQTYLRVVSVS